jgi:hypothetical protein
LYDQFQFYEAGRVKAGHTAMQNPPDWWSFELELSGHVLDRMLDRGFSEADLRLMFEAAITVRAGRLDGRWIVKTVHQREPWEIVVEPDHADRVIVVVTAYRRGVKWRVPISMSRIAMVARLRLIIIYRGVQEM